MLTQSEADKLIAIEKVFVTPATISMPPGIDITYDLVSDDREEFFLLDVWRGSYRQSKLKFQNRARQVIVLVRLCVDGPHHTNPDGQKLNGTHIHVYREGFDDRWAYGVDSNQFEDLKNVELTLEQFCRFCNIALPTIQGWLI